MGLFVCLLVMRPRVPSGVQPVAPRTGAHAAAAFGRGRKNNAKKLTKGAPLDAFTHSCARTAGVYSAPKGRGTLPHLAKLRVCPLI